MERPVADGETDVAVAGVAGEDVATGVGAVVGVTAGAGAAVGAGVDTECNGVLSSVARVSSAAPVGWPRAARSHAVTSRYCRWVNDPSAASGMVALVNSYNSRVEAKRSSVPGPLSGVAKPSLPVGP